jgi:hypothetical protein
MKIVLLIFTTFLFSAAALTAEGDFVPFADEAFYKTIEALREERILAENMLRGISVRTLQKWTTKKLDNEALTAIANYIAARSLIASNQSSEAISFLLRAAGHSITAPEAIFGLSNLSGEEAFQLNYSTFQECMAQLLPLSRWGGMYGTEQIGRPNFPANHTPYNIPIVDAAHFLKIAEVLEGARIYKHAYFSFLEYIYAVLACAPITEDYGTRNAAWFTPDTVVLWRRAAENAFKAGMMDEARACIAKAIIFSVEEERLSILEEVRSWRIGAGSPPGSDVPPNGRLLSDVISLYMEIGAHPRAIALVSDYSELFFDPEATKRKIQNEWLQLVESMKSSRMKLVLYGTEVWPNGDPLVVTIPWPCSKEAIVKIGRLLQK